MGIGIYSALDIAKSSLLTQQAAIGVTANNIANVNTPGYSRQTPVLSPIDPQQVNGLYFGRGVELAAITKSYDTFLNNSISLETALLGQASITDAYLSQAEGVFSLDETTGLSAQLNDFWNAWHDLATNPAGTSERAVLLSAAESVCDTFNTMAANLQRIQDDANSRIAEVVNQVNQLSAEIADLNGQVTGSIASGTNPNDITDQRTRAIEALAKLVDVNVVTQGNGQVTVLTAGGRPLVAEGLSWNLQVRQDASRDNQFAVYYASGGQLSEITDQIGAGTLKGLLDVRDAYVPGYMHQLDQMASTLVTEVNRLHASGYDLNGGTGNLFFSPVPLLASGDETNSGSGRLYDAAITDPVNLRPGDYTFTFATQYPFTATYETTDAASGERLFEVDATNNVLMVYDSNGTGTPVAAVIAAGTYTGDELAAALEQSLQAASQNNQEYTVRYEQGSRQFIIRNHGTQDLDLRWDDTRTTSGYLLGFDDTLQSVCTGDSVMSATSVGRNLHAANMFAVTGGNNSIVFDDGSGVSRTAQLQVGNYTAEEMAVELERALEAAGAASFSVLYDQSGRFTLVADATTAASSVVTLGWSDPGSTASALLGFDSVDAALDTADVTARTQIADQVSGDYTYFEREFLISDLNNTVVFSDGGAGDGTGGTSVTLALAEGAYTGAELAAVIEQGLEQAPGASGQDYVVTYDIQQGRFTVLNAAANQHNLTVDWAASNAAFTLGFSGADVVAPAAYVRSDTECGTWVNYDQLRVGGISTRLTSEGDPPRSGDTFTINGLSGAAATMSLDPLTAADTTLVAAAFRGFDIDGGNNVLVFDDDGDLSDGTSYRIELDPGRYTPEELALEIERQLEQNGNSYRVLFDVDTERFTIQSNPGNTADLHLRWEHPDTNMAFTLGFETRMFDLQDGTNNQLVFTEAGQSYRVTLTPGAYTGAELAANLEQQLENAGAGEYTVSYDETGRRFTIANDGDDPVVIAWSDPDAQDLAALMGFGAVDQALAAGGSIRSDSACFAIGSGAAATSDFTTDGAQVGDNRVALAIADLQDAKLLAGETATLGGFYSTLVSAAGSDAADAAAAVTQEEFLLQQYENRRQSVAGVSLDEEMVDLIKYQQAYAASSKMISTLDSMLNDLLSIR